MPVQPFDPDSSCSVKPGAQAFTRPWQVPFLAIALMVASILTLGALLLGPDHYTLPKVLGAWMAIGLNSLLALGLWRMNRAAYLIGLILACLAAMLSVRAGMGALCFNATFLGVMISAWPAYMNRSEI